MRSRRLCLALMASAAVLTISAQAYALDDDVLVAVDEAKIIRLTKPVSQIIIGNPSIADISVRNSKTLVVTGKSYGVTNVIVLGSDGKEIINSTLAVQSNRNRMVTVQKGALRQSFVCAPECQSVISIGDSNDQFEQISKQVQSKQSLGQNAAESASAQ